MYQKIKNFFHLFESIAANVYFGFPSRKLTIIGVTGTDGKTTTTHLIFHILKFAGKKTSMISSIVATGLHTTTPSGFEIQRSLFQAIKRGDEYFVLETTSHGIDQQRIWGIDYKVTILTNISEEHLYHHKTFENYFLLKMKLLRLSKKILINREDQSFGKVKAYLKKYHKSFSTYSFRGNADYTWPANFSTDIKGDYNKQNILAAYGCCLKLGIPEDDIIKALRTFNLPAGRLETVFDKDFRVIIDFAHTPAAIENVLNTIAEAYIKKSGRIIHVFGAASERDDVKRPKMGEASSNYADIIILTEEDYRRESFDRICDQIKVGLQQNNFKEIESGKLSSDTGGKFFTRIKNREEAINAAINKAKKNDVVVLTGKSHEKSLNRDGKEFAWDEYEVVKKALRQRGLL